MFDTTWLEEFKRKNGRPLRILHIGNIANNAYFNSKFLNAFGVESDVFCYSNYHIMSSPEWEEADFVDLPKDHYFPDWWNLNISGYEQPRWFAQGPWKLCIRYLISRQNGESQQAEILWEKLRRARYAAHESPLPNIHKLFRRYGKYLPEPYFSQLKTYFQSVIESIQNLYASGSSIRRQEAHDLEDGPDKDSSWLIKEFNNHFPNRGDQLTLNDLEHYKSKAQSLSPLLKNYDIVQAYATDALYPLILGYKPYVAFEHGTLRDAPYVDWPFKGPFYNNSEGRLAALAYACADHVFITNADNLTSAQRLGIYKYSPIGHPFDETSFALNKKVRNEIRTKIDAEYIFLCPIRHDWKEKGTDKYILALPLLRKALGNRFKVCFMPWGKELENSRRLIADLGCEDLVEWVGPFGQVWFSRWLISADVIFDQLSYESFSGLTPRALACGVPVIARYNPGSMEWMFPEPAPVLNAENEEDILHQTLTALQPGYREGYQIKAREWVMKYHSSKHVLDELLTVYKDLILKGQTEIRKDPEYEFIT